MMMLMTLRPKSLLEMVDCMVVVADFNVNN